MYSLNSELREWRGVGLLRKPLRPSRTAGAERRGPGEAWPFRLAVRRRLRHWLGSRHLTRAAGPGSFRDGGVRGADSAGEPQVAQAGRGGQRSPGWRGQGRPEDAAAVCRRRAGPAESLCGPRGNAGPWASPPAPWFTCVGLQSVRQLKSVRQCLVTVTVPRGWYHWYPSHAGVVLKPREEVFPFLFQYFSDFLITRKTPIGPEWSLILNTC